MRSSDDARAYSVVDLTGDSELRPANGAGVGERV
jgi:hypothetical protein